MASPSAIKVHMEAALLERWASHMSDNTLREAAALDPVLFEAEVTAATIELEKREIEDARTLLDKDLIDYVLGLGSSHQSRIDQIEAILREGRLPEIDRDVLEGVKEALFQQLSNNAKRDYRKFLEEETTFMKMSIEEKLSQKLRGMGGDEHV